MMPWPPRGVWGITPPKPGPRSTRGERDRAVSAGARPTARDIGLGPGPVVLAGVGGDGADCRRVRPRRHSFRRAERPVFHVRYEGVARSPAAHSWVPVHGSGTVVGYSPCTVQVASPANTC